MEVSPECHAHRGLIVSHLQLGNREHADVDPKVLLHPLWRDGTEFRWSTTPAAA